LTRSLRDPKTSASAVNYKTEALGELREDIEAKEGRMKYLAHQSEYRTISVLAYQMLPYAPPPKSESEGFVSRLATALVDGWTGFVYFFLNLTSIWPALIVICILMYRILKRYKLRRQLKVTAKKKDPATSKEPARE
jgi:hypothetical protein